MYRKAEDFTFKPRFDTKYWESLEPLLFSTPYGPVMHFSRGEFRVYKGAHSNGLTGHYDHAWMIDGAYPHDIALLENYPNGRILSKGMPCTLRRGPVDRLLYSVWLDTAEKSENKWERRRRKFQAWTHYKVVRLYSMLRVAFR